MQMYAITFDLDNDMLERTYHVSSYKNAYNDIRKVMIANGFTWQQGSVYFGNTSTTAVSCFMVVQNLTLMFPWFSQSVRDIRMLRIEELNDLRPFIDQTVNIQRGNMP